MLKLSFPIKSFNRAVQASGSVEISVFSPSIETFDALKPNGRTWSLSLITRHFGSRKYSFGPIRSFYSDCPKYWPYLFGPCTFVIILSNAATRWHAMSREVISFFSELSWKNHSRYNQVIQGHKKAWLNTHWPLCAVYLFDNRFVNAPAINILVLSSNKLARITQKVAPSTNPVYDRLWLPSWPQCGPFFLRFLHFSKHSHSLGDRHIFFIREAQCIGPQRCIGFRNQSWR